MCAIVGAVVSDVNHDTAREANSILNHILSKSTDRGRDGRGWIVNQHPVGATEQFGSPGYMVIEKSTERLMAWYPNKPFFENEVILGSMIANLRAEPTTEYVRNKSKEDQQPYIIGPWAIVHNGTIANDKELRTNELDTKIDSAAIVEQLARAAMHGQTWEAICEHFRSKISKIKGSYAILAMHAEHPGKILVACNYRPIWVSSCRAGIFFASARTYFPSTHAPQMIEPYSMWSFEPGRRICLLKPPTPAKRALVVCSGGMDSTVAVAAMRELGYDIVLLHFNYGSRAQSPENEAIWKIAQHYKIGVWMRDLPVWSPDDSPLLRKDSKIAGGEEGAEFAHEWVPARNLVMLAHAVAIAEARSFGYVVLGNNLEEAGAYPDNEPEFINRFSDLLPFAVGDGKRVQILMPVGNLMKHEIVALGHSLKAPLDLTWSCYRAGPVHCGTCGPCHMRRTAFRINNLPEVIPYANEDPNVQSH